MAAAVATLSESVPLAIGMLARTSAARMACSVRPGAFCADHHRHLLSLLTGRFGGLPQSSIPRWGQSHDLVVALSQHLQVSLPSSGSTREFRPWQSQHVPHRNAHTAAVQGIGGSSAEQHGIHPQPRGVAEDRPDILVIPHTFQHRNHTAGFWSILHLLQYRFHSAHAIGGVISPVCSRFRGGKPICRGNQASVHIEARNLFEHFAGHLIDGEFGVNTRKSARKLGLDRPKLPREPHNRASRVRAGEQSGNDEGTLGND